MESHETIRIIKNRIPAVCNPARLGILLCSCLLLIVSGCGSARRSLPDTATLDRNPALAQGEQVFFHYCHQCHPAGEAGIGPALNNKPLPKFLIKWQTRQGFGAMPGFSEEIISSRELDQLAAYLVALRQSR